MENKINNELSKWERVRESLKETIWYRIFIQLKGGKQNE